MATQISSLTLANEIEQGFLTLQLNSLRKTFEISEFINIGREDSVDIQIRDPFVSTRHCRVEKRGGQFWVRDLRSRNGTFINGTRVKEGLLQDGDRIRVGEMELIFSSEKKGWASPFLLHSQNSDWQMELDRLPLLAKSDLPVLINGQSGSGKEIIARSLHQLSNRSNGPFVSVNCSALTESLIESELFGHVRGSFTGAADDRKGAFLSAKGGTLFLDEIGDLPASLQPKLLRALENQEIKPVGSDRPITVDVRIVAATHKDLSVLVRKSQFREDLFYRLNVLRIRVPALRERMEDFDALIKFFCRSSRVNFTFEAIQKMKEYNWPGQIRELKNFVARAGALFRSTYIEASQIESLFQHEIHEATPRPKSRDYLETMEIDLISKKLVENGGNIRKTARDLGIPKSTLYDRILTYGIPSRTKKRKTETSTTADTLSVS